MHDKNHQTLVRLLVRRPQGYAIIVTWGISSTRGRGGFNSSLASRRSGADLVYVGHRPGSRGRESPFSAACCQGVLNVGRPITGLVDHQGQILEEACRVVSLVPAQKVSSSDVFVIGRDGVAGD